ncbi:MAG: hypothetical protein ACOYNS_08855 [Bacteroidota bacterium]
MEATKELLLKEWVLSSFYGWLTGVVLVIITSGMFDAAGLEGFQFYLGISIGGSIGFFQWRKISHPAGIGTEWIWSSMFGMGIPFLVMDLLKRFAGISLGDNHLPVCITAGALVTALWQTFILKKKFTAALPWLWTCLGGWILASWTVISIDYVKLFIHHNLALFFINLTLIVSGGAVLGAVTGSTLISILRQPNSAQ